MESALASWQVENFSTSAEFSPPISPSPPSPTLYSNAHAGDRDAPAYIKPEVDSGSSLAARAQLASRILHNLELEDYHFSQYENQNERWTEESVNLELFEDLEFDDFSFTRPLTPDSQEFKNQEQLQEFNESPQPSPSAEFPSESYDELSAEFQNILAGLSAQVTCIDNGEVIELLGIPCSLEEIQRLNYSQQAVDESGQNGNDGDDRSDGSGSEAGNSMDMDDQSHTFDDFELQLIGLDDGTVSQGMSSYSGVSSPSSSLSEEEIDSADHTCESILDALLQGDLNTAKSFISPNMEMELVVSPTSSKRMSPQPTYASPSKSGTRSLAPVPAVPKSGRCGGSSGIKKPRLPSNTDKSQRKKEQNKTAATRYREKKKIQAAIITVQEDALEKVNNELMTKRDDLQRQVLIYKELLRAVMLDRKVKKETSSIASVGRHTGSKRMIK